MGRSKGKGPRVSDDHRAWTVKRRSRTTFAAIILHNHGTIVRSAIQQLANPERRGLLKVSWDAYLAIEFRSSSESSTTHQTSDTVNPAVNSKNNTMTMAVWRALMDREIPWKFVHYDVGAHLGAIRARSRRWICINPPNKVC